jgi:hypothetical protein
MLVIDQLTDESFRSLSQYDIKSDKNIYYMSNLIGKRRIKDKIHNVINNLHDAQEVSININFKKNKTYPDFEVITFL